MNVLTFSKMEESNSTIVIFHLLLVQLMINIKQYIDNFFEK